MIDLALLQIIKNKEDFTKVYRYIPRSAIDKRTKAVTEDIAKYFELCPEEDKINFPAFRSMFFTTFHKGMSKDDCDYYNKLLDKMELDVSEGIKKNIINQLLELEFATELGNIIQEYEVGGEIDIVYVVGSLVDSVKNKLVKAAKFEFATFDDSTIKEAQDTEQGYTWHIPVMNNHYRRIMGGDQYIIAARPGKGKTTFLTHLNAHTGAQMAKGKVIVWFNNESRRQRIMARQIQSVMQMTDSELKNLQAAGTLRDEYAKRIGSVDRVRVYDIHGMANYQLEEILESIGTDNVGSIIFDMLDNVKMPHVKDMREDQRLEQLYQWSRELGVRYNCPVFATSQISNEGQGLLFPTENMLKDSKTGKQGACDGIIMIGTSDDPLLEKKRGLSMPKTKSKIEGMHDMREEVILDADKGVYV